MPERSLSNSITNLVTTVINKVATLINLHNASANAHSDIRTDVNSKAANDHVHGNIKNDGSIGTASGKPLITGQNGLIQAGSFELDPSKLKKNGPADVGIRDTFARSDHVHPTDTSRASTALASTSENGLLSKEDKAIIDALPTTYATQSQIEDLVAGNLNLVGYVKKDEIVDNLTSNNSNVPLSAKQGKELKTAIDGKANTTHYHKYIGDGSATSSDNLNYTVSITGVQHTHGTLIAVLNNKSGDNQVGATLNVNNLGAKPIYYKNQTIRAGQFKYRSLSLFMYATWTAFNAGNGAWIMLDDLDTDTDTTYTANTLKDPTAHNQAISTAANATQTSINTALDTKLATHKHGQIENNGSIGTTSGKPIITTSNGVLTTGSFGSEPGMFCAGDDTRLSDTRNPKAHTHVKNDITNFSHAHGKVTYEGKIDTNTSTVNKVVVTDSDTYLKTISKVPFANLNISKANITGLGIVGDAESDASKLEKDGTANVGSRNTYARGDHRHPTDTSRAASDHVHGSISNTGTIGSTANLPLITGNNGTIGTGSFESDTTKIQKDGTVNAGSRNTFARGDHRHPTDTSRAPTNHASSGTDYGVSNNSNYGHSMASSTSPKMNGSAKVGDETAKFARGDHVHPTDTSRAPTNHASSGTDYGIGKSNAYGHVKLSDSYQSTSGADSGIAASSKAVNNAYNAITSQNSSQNSPESKTLSNGWNGTVKVFVKNGWCIVLFEGLKNATVHNNPVSICDTGYVNKIGQNVYSFWDGLGTTNFGAYVRVNSMGVLEGRCFSSNHPIYGHIIFPIE